MYQERFYRNQMKDETLLTFEVKVLESDLWIMSDVKQETFAKKMVEECRQIITDYGKRQPEFITALKPVVIEEKAHGLIKQMNEAAKKADVGPMATVAGAVSKYVSKGLSKQTNELIIENGGDLWMQTEKERIVGIYAGDSRFSHKIAMKINPNDTPMGICTSAGTLGHSLSFGKADAAIIISKDILLADAVATATGNRVQSAKDIQSALMYAMSIDGILGVIIIIENEIGIYGNVELVKL